jgi:hypothetical protein
MALLLRAVAGNKFLVIAIAGAIIATIVIVASLPRGPGYDRFGVKEIYPTAKDGQEWYLDSSNPRDGVFMMSPAATPIYTERGGFLMTGRETDSENTGLRMYVMPPAGWHNVEMTGYVKLTSFTFAEEFAWAVRSGQHADDNPCDGTAYYGALSFAGDAWFQKEVFHAEGGYTDKRHGNMSVGPLLDRWIGIKMMAYNLDDSSVKLELWVDRSGYNDWLKIAETVDNGGWASSASACGKSPDHVHSEPRPRVMFRIDNAMFEFKSLSVREIATS